MPPSGESGRSSFICPSSWHSGSSWWLLLQQHCSSMGSGSCSCMGSGLLHGGCSSPVVQTGWHLLSSYGWAAVGLCLLRQRLLVGFHSGAPSDLMPGAGKSCSFPIYATAHLKLHNQAHFRQIKTEDLEPVYSFAVFDTVQSGNSTNRTQICCCV